ncbi:MAG: radical SAM protein [Candidatus Omnitrophota bacterium]
MKIFHFKEKIDSLSKDTDKVMSPVHIRIKPTNVCNHNCRYCAYRTDNVQLGKNMAIKDYIPREKMMEIIEDMEEMGVKAVTFSGGGEPFCYPYLLEIIKRLSRTSVKFSALTNGSNLTGKVAEFFARHGTWIRVSIDGWDDESYATYRGVPKGEFSKVMKNMENFKKLGGKCYLGVSIIVDKNNAGHIYKFSKKLKTVGVDSVKVSACIFSDDGKKNNEYHKPIFEQVKDQVNRAINDFKNEKFEISDTYHKLDEKFNKEYTWCPYLQILPVIGADQNVYSCQDKAYNIEEGLLGSISGIRFKDFWISNKRKFFKINPSLHCKHHCVANAKNKFVLEYLNADEKHLGFV